MVDLSGGEQFDRAFRRIAQSLIDGTEVRVGFLEGSTYPDGTSVATIAALNNFGAPGAGVPARPFFSEMVAEKSPDWAERFKRVLKEADYSVALALERMGQGIAGQLRQAIVAFDGVPNSPVTDLLKQRFPKGGQTFADVLKARSDVADGTTAPAGKQLVWSGDMLAAVDSEVVK